MNKDEVICNVCKLIKHPSGIYMVCMVNIIDKGVDNVSHFICMNDPLEVFLSNYD